MPNSSSLRRNVTNDILCSVYRRVYTLITRYLQSEREKKNKSIQNQKPEAISDTRLYTSRNSYTRRRTLFPSFEACMYTR